MNNKSQVEKTLTTPVRLAPKNSMMAHNIVNLKNKDTIYKMFEYFQLVHH